MSSPDPSDTPDSGSHERIEPFEELSPFSLDHLARYALASPLAKGKRVLDAACGTGFGAHLLAEAGARRVDALDRDEDALLRARQLYAHPAVAYHQADLDTLAGLPEGPWDLVCCFETLEHLPAPKRLVAAIAQRLAPEGLAFLSVPGEADADEANPFHLHHFTRASFEDLLREHFPQFQVFTQHLTVGATFRREGEDAAEALELPLEADQAPAPAHGYLAIAGRSLPKGLSLPRFWHSPAVWQQLQGERRELHAQCRHFSEAHARVFAEHSDLQQKFSVCLAWGEYHYHRAEHQHSEENFLEPLQARTFAESNAVRAELQTARERISQLESELAHLRANAPGGVAHRRRHAVLDFLRRWRRRS